MSGIGVVGTSIYYAIELSYPLLKKEDREYQFLYHLSTKIFRLLKTKKKLGADQKDDVIKWLKEKFNSSLENDTNNWQNFKSLCESQKLKETKSGKDMEIEESRLCFLDTTTDSENGNNNAVKGALFNWGNRADGNSYSAFLKVSKNNYELWEEFNKQYSRWNPVDKFDEWFNTDPHDLKKFVEGTLDMDSNMSYN